MADYGEPTWERTPRLCYGDGAVFVRVCPHCGRFVKADDTITCNGLGEWQKGPNANCSVHGRVEMPFEGYTGEFSGIEE